MENEIWKPIKGYEGKYFVSSLGRIKSLPNRSRRTELILKPQNQTYSFIDLCKDGKVKKLTIHRIVAINFLDNPQNKPDVNHIDGNKHNNKLSNLEWVTKSENIKHSYATGLNSCVGAKNSQCKLTEKEAVEIYNSNARTKDLSIQYNITQSTICDIRKGRSWTHATLNK